MSHPPLACRKARWHPPEHHVSGFSPVWLISHSKWWWRMGPGAPWDSPAPSAGLGEEVKEFFFSSHQWGKEGEHSLCCPGVGGLRTQVRMAGSPWGAVHILHHGSESLAHPEPSVGYPYLAWVTPIQAPSWLHEHGQRRESQRAGSRTPLAACA